MSDTLHLNADKVANDQAKSSGGQQPSPVKKLAGAKDTASSKTRWTVPLFPHDFNLDSAKDLAYKRAESYMNEVLGRDDLSIEMEMSEAGRQGQVYDVSTGEKLNVYQGQDVLKLYAQRFKERGIIVDGRL